LLKSSTALTTWQTTPANVADFWIVTLRAVIDVSVAVVVLTIADLGDRRHVAETGAPGAGGLAKPHAIAADANVSCSRWT
jgi:hypothetical protein